MRNPFRSRTEENAFLKLVQSTAARKADATQRIAYYHDKQADDTFNLIAQRFSDPHTFRIFCLNLVKRVIDKSATTYRVAPKRTFIGMDQQAGDDLYRVMNADAMLKRASRYTKLLKTTALRVAWVNNVPTLYLHTPAILDVEAADPERPSRIIVTNTSTRPEDVTYADWTATTFNLRDARGYAVRSHDNPDNVNPYGVLPFVPLFDALPDADFFLPGGNDLIECQQAVNVALSNLWRSVELQAHGQAYAVGVSATTRLETGPNRAILLPQGGSFGYAAPNSPIGEILSAIEFVMRQVAATNAIGSEIFDLSKVAESGSAKHAERLDLKEARADDIALWRIAEARLFDVLKAVINTHTPGTIAENASLRVDFAEQQDQLSEAETLTNAQTKQALGIWSPVDALMASNPDGFSTRGDAYRELVRRKSETEELTLPL
jgi:hypothetical protein